MPHTTNYDFLTFFYCVISGAALCILADVFRAIRISFRPRRATVFFGDVLFFIIAALTTFFMGYVFSNGQIRWYILTGELLGAVSFRLLLSTMLVKILCKLNHSIKRVFAPVKSIIHTVSDKIYDFIFMLDDFFEKNILKIITSLLYNKRV